MITVDGSFGYGQVLRTAIGLSCLTMSPVKVTNIRVNRPKPGLMPQHLMGIKTSGEFCRAVVIGLNISSMEVEFTPTEKNFEDKKIDIGTAGSIPLLLQTLTPFLIFADKKISLQIVGGTSGLGSPTIEYLKYVTFPILSLLGVRVPNIEVVRQGFYPKGQGFVKVEFSPIKKLHSVDLIQRGKVKKVYGTSIAGSLAKHVAHRQAYAAQSLLMAEGYKEVQLSILDNIYTASSGTSITLAADCWNTVLGSDNIGKIGVPAEQIGKECARVLLQSIKSNVALDKWMADQIIPFVALAEGHSEIIVEEITEHCRTNMRVCEEILNVKFEVDEINKKISVDGIGFKI